MGRGQEPAVGDRVDFFISYARADDESAQWIAWVLEEAGYSTVIQAWDFVAGSRYIDEMHRAVRNATRTIAVLSTAYLASAFAQAELRAAWADDPLGEQRKLLVVRVEDCDRPGLLRQVVGVDIFGLTPAEARDQILKAARGGRRKPPSAPALPRRRHDQALDLQEVANQLQIAMRRQWEDEAALRRLNEPYPLPVSWEPADPELVDNWETIVRLATTGAGRPVPGHWAADPAELVGGGRELVDVLDRVPTGRLVVLGEPGSGKTMLAVRLVLDLLVARSAGGPLPMLVPLASWDPNKQDLDRWLESHLVRNYPALATPVPDGGATRARALLNAGMILPVLDGLDEMPSAVRARAIMRINDALRPGHKVVLTARTSAYRAIAAAGGKSVVHLVGAAVIHLRPQEGRTVAEYLRASAGGREAASRWNDVLAALDTDPQRPVAQALTTPLMAHLARATFTPRPGEEASGLPDPAVLLDPVRFPTRDDITTFLFDGFIAAAYRSSPYRTRRTRWSPGAAERWLIFLACHLERTQHGDPDLAWWRVPAVISPRRPWIPPVTVGLVMGLAVMVTLGLSVAPTFGLAFGLMFGPAVGHAAGESWGVRVPARRLLWDPRVGRMFGPAVGLAVAILLGFTVGPVVGSIVGLAVGLAALLLVSVQAAPADLTVAASPYFVLINDRAAFRALVLTGSLVFGLAVGITGALSAGLTAGLAGGLVVGLAVGLAVGLSRTAWGTFALARAWLAARGRLPWRLMAFLADAHARGVLRQDGAVYQFRHAELQRYLSNKPPSASR